MLWDLQVNMLVFKITTILSKAQKFHRFLNLDPTPFEMLRLSKLHQGWKSPLAHASPVQRDSAHVSRWDLETASSKQPLFPAGASSPCHMGPPRAVGVHRDRPEDASVSASPGVPRAPLFLTLSLRLSPPYGEGNSRASTGVVIPMGLSNALQKQRQQKDVIPAILYFHSNGCSWRQTALLRCFFLFI